MHRFRLCSPAGFLVGLFALTASAQTPPESGISRANGPWSFPAAAGASHWWTRYGEPVNAAQLATHSAGGSTSSGAYPASLYGPGYVYGPGSCDCPPPCIWDLWTGYVQNPKRCHPGCGWLHGRCGHCCTGAAAGCRADCSANYQTFCLGQRMREVLHHCQACGTSADRGPACGCTLPASAAPPGVSAAAIP